MCDRPPETVRRAALGIQPHLISRFKRTSAAPRTTVLRMRMHTGGSAGASPSRGADCAPSARCAVAGTLVFDVLLVRRDATRHRCASACRKPCSGRNRRHGRANVLVSRQCAIARQKPSAGQRSASNRIVSADSNGHRRHPRRRFLECESTLAARQEPRPPVGRIAPRPRVVPLRAHGFRPHVMFPSAPTRPKNSRACGFIKTRCGVGPAAPLVAGKDHAPDGPWHTPSLVSSSLDSLLGGTEGQTETQVVVPEVRRVEAAIRRPAVHGAVDPTAASVHPLRARFYHGIRFAGEFLFVSVEAPLPGPALTFSLQQ